LGPSRSGAFPIRPAAAYSSERSMCANVIATPRVFDSHGCSTDRGRAARRASRDRKTQSASLGGQFAEVPDRQPTSGRRCRSRDAIERSRRCAARQRARRGAHSIGPSHPLLNNCRINFTHFDLVHAPGGCTIPRPQPGAPAGRGESAAVIAVLHCPFRCALPGGVVGPNHQCLSAFAILYRRPERFVAGVAGEFAGEFGYRRGGSRNHRSERNPTCAPRYGPMQCRDDVRRG